MYDAVAERAAGFQVTSNNTATGYGALLTNTTGYNNTAAGTNSLYNNTAGVYNTAIGFTALANNTLGGSNIAIGPGALSTNTTGSNNTAIGYLAGSNVSVSNSNNIHIGNEGFLIDTSTIRIGDPSLHFQFSLQVCAAPSPATTTPFRS
jgi:hypothetical protein